MDPPPLIALVQSDCHQNVQFWCRMSPSMIKWRKIQHQSAILACTSTIQDSCRIRLIPDSHNAESIAGLLSVFTKFWGNSNITWIKIQVVLYLCGLGQGKDANFDTNPSLKGPLQLQDKERWMFCCFCGMVGVMKEPGHSWFVEDVRKVPLCKVHDYIQVIWPVNLCLKGWIISVWIRWSFHL